MIDETQSQSVTQATMQDEHNAVSGRILLPRSKLDVLQMYKQAVDTVKVYCPGFTRTHRNEFCDIRINNDKTGIANATLMALSDDALTSEDTVFVSKDEDLACRTFFPVFDTDYGCKIYDGDSCDSAICYQNGSVYELIILFKELHADDLLYLEFAQMMTPCSSREVINNISAVIPVINTDNCSSTLRYYNCEIHCCIDIKSGRLLKMTHKMIADILISAKLDLVLTEAEFDLNATIIDHLYFTNFIWH